MPKEIAPMNLFGVFPGRKFRFLWNFPHAIGFEVPERKFGMIRLPCRAKIPKQLPERFLDIGKRGEALLASHNSSERQQDQKRLVRRPLVSPLPDIQVRKLGEKL